MKILLEISADEAIALRRFANDFHIDTDHAVRFVLREYLIASGYLEQDEETEDALKVGRG